MGGYVASFSVYTMAMIGLICFAVFVYKKIMDGGLGKKHTNYIEIEDTLHLNPRKSLHVIKAGNEKFLIASDMDRTTLISKLNEGRQELPIYDNYQNSKQTFHEAMDIATRKQTIQGTSQPTTKRVHLEPITRKNETGIGISNLRKAMDTRAGRTVQRTVPAQAQGHKPVQKQPVQKAVRPPVNQIQQQPVRAAGSTMKDMAKKINEL